MHHGHGKNDAGIIIISNGYAGTQTEEPTLQCIHCQHTWVRQPGSGIKRGFCMKCMGPICGPKCAECRGPWEKHLDRQEQQAKLYRHL